jgi:hypothetical protein
MANTILSRSRTPTMTWAALSGASLYNAQFSADPRFSTVFYETTSLAVASVTPSSLTDAQKWFWRFRALLDTTRYADQTNATGAASGNALRDAAARTYLAQSVTVAAGLPISRVTLSLKKTGIPTGNIWLEVWSSSGGAPLAITGAASANVNVATLTAAFANYNFDFAAPVAVTAATVYFLVLRGDFAIDGANYAQWEADAAGSYTGGAAYKGDGTPAWSTNGTPDQIFTTYYYRWAPGSRSGPSGSTRHSPLRTRLRRTAGSSWTPMTRPTTPS